MKKVNCKIISLILSLTLLLGISGVVSGSEPERRSGDQYVIDSWLENSQLVAIDGSALEIKEIYTLRYEWAIPDNTYKKGDVLEFSIPKEFVVTDASNFLLTENEKEIGIVKVKGNSTEGFYFELTFTTDYVEDHSDIHGIFDISVYLNDRYVQPNNTINITYPDKVIPTEITPDNSESVGGGGGGDGTGHGNITTNKKTGRIDTRDLFNSETNNFDIPTRVFSWQITLGHETLLGEANSFDEIESITLEDKLDDQKLIGMNQFDKNWKNAFSWKKIFFDTIGFGYGGISEEEMGLIYLNGKDYSSSFKIDILPQILKWEAHAAENNAKMKEFGFEYFSVPLDSENIVDEQEFSNKAKVTINYKDRAPDSWELTDSVHWSISGGSAIGRTGAIEFYKVDGDNQKGLQGAHFDLYKLNSNGEAVKIKTDIISDENGRVNVTGLTVGDYYLVETVAPTGYDLNDAKIAFTLTTDDLSTDATNIKFKTLDDVQNLLSNSTVNIKVSKTWEDNNNQDGMRPNDIKVQLYADKKATGEVVTLSEANNWSHTWQDLDEKSNGKAITYTVKEVGTIPGYTVTLNDKDSGNMILTNSHTPEVTSVKGTKTWNDKDDQDGKRPAFITVNLLADGEKVDEHKVTAKENWQYEFTNLPKYANGDFIIYTVTEDNVPDYSTEINGYDMTNSYTPGVTSLTVTKAWNDSNNQDGMRPNDIKVQLYADKKATGEVVTLSEANNWSHTWQDLDEKSNGKAITYTVKEVGTIPGYTVTLNDKDSGNMILTNSHTSEVTSVKGAKTWNDKDDQDGKRPAFITVNLLADGEKVDEQKVTAKENWQYEFTNLPKYANGDLIIYTVTEDNVPDYSTEINGYDMTNSYTPGVTSLTVTKAWNDSNNQDGMRPNDIKVQLYADKKATGEVVTLSETNNWSHTWQDLDEKSNGKAITYTVKEVGTIPGYTVTLNDKDSGNMILTNSHTSEVTSVKGAKTWNDKDDQDGKRPAFITVNLLADGKKVDSQKVTEKENWQYEFTNLPKYANGEVITYTVTENHIPEYSTEINGYDMTNSYTPGVTSLTVTKAWNDSNNQDGMRPNNIKVQLYADGKEKGAAVTLTEANNWSHTWQDLDEKSNGKAITYTVEELDIPKGYEMTIIEENGNIIITNSHTPKLVNKPTVPGNTNNGSGSLPKTGEINSRNLTIIGFIILSIAFSIRTVMIYLEKREAK